MSTIAMPSTRIAALRADAQARGGSFAPRMNPCTRDVALWRALGERRSRVQVRARLLRELVGLAPIELRPNWRLAGEHLAPSVGGFGFALPSRSVAECAPWLTALGVPGDQHAEVADAVRMWTESGEPLVATGASEPSLTAGHGSWDPQPTAHTVYWASGWIENHSVRDYAKVLRLGFAGIGAQTEARLREADICSPDFPNQENF